MQFEPIRRRVWADPTKTVFVWLPDDKRTYRIVDRDGNQLVKGSFLTFSAATKEASKIVH